MRLVRFTRLALAAAALAALAAGSAAAAADMVLKLKDLKGETATTTALKSFSWGTSNAALRSVGGLKMEVETIEMSAPADPAASDSAKAKDKTAAAPKPISHDLRTNVIARTVPPGGDPDRPVIAGTVPNASEATVGAAQSLTVGGARTDSRGASRPLLAKGSLRVAGSLPGCAVGATYPEATLEGGGMSYELKDVTITACAADQVSLEYARVQVRGWDPDRKQQ